MDARARVLHAVGMSSAVVQVPEWELEGGLVVRPDVLVIAVAARVDGQAVAASVRALREATVTLQTRVAAAHAGATLVPGKLRLADGTPSSIGKSDAAPVGLEGAVLVPLAETLDYWERAALCAQLTELVAEVAHALRKAKPVVTLSFRAPVAKVRDVTKHRAAVAARWNTQLRALLEGASGVTLGATWDAPLEIEQQSISLDEVRLFPRAKRPGA